MRTATVLITGHIDPASAEAFKYAREALDWHTGSDEPLSGIRFLGNKTWQPVNKEHPTYAADYPTFKLAYSDADNEYVATCDDFPGVERKHYNPAVALEQAQKLVRMSLKFGEHPVTGELLNEAP